MSITHRRASLVLLSSCLMLGLTLPACGKSDSKDKPQQRKVTVKIGGAAAPGPVTANVAEFDPNADISLDMDDKYGNERPDEYEVQQAFFAAFETIGGCVEAEHKRRGSDEQFEGNVYMAVKLNPEKHTPFGVNATLPDGFEEASKLKTCMREAVGEVKFPKYDGPPTVVEIEFELEPEWVWVDE
jgi:hypothetical protein